ncbi:hypothetical protein CW745_16370 [Psychromonas sp. psych-6C06]|uniref:hypothetical protein n=1 Tax=Psychromonas sp. psych-6C06 TaxID=2058089 RepID=UPI000C31DB4C|nr:hypothetical protein [Psychromonas sp. psych-6C06]PKF60182.1 hypothetical protein CW745_16370 [Psychromonas sp. psych-6C06]
MSVEDYISEAMKEDVQYARYVELCVNLANKEMSSLNDFFREKNMPTYDAEVRIKNSDVVNSEVSPYAFYINSGVFYTCFKTGFHFYSELFSDSFLNKALKSSALLLPFQFILYHELSHIYRAHDDSYDGSINKDSFIKATEMDADLMSVAKLYRVLQSSFQSKCIADREMRFLVLLCAIVVLCVMSQHSNDNVYQGECERLWDIVLKISHLKEDRNSEAPVDVDLTSDTTKGNFDAQIDFLLRLENLPILESEMVTFINSFIEHISTFKESRTITAWEKIKDKVAKASKTIA